MLQNVVLDELFGKIVGLDLLFVQRFLQEFGMGARGIVNSSSTLSIMVFRAVARSSFTSFC